MKWCKKCGAQLEDDQKYCPECGARQETECEIGQEEDMTERNQECTAGRNRAADRSAEKRKNSGMLPALVILFIGIGIIAGMIFAQKQKTVMVADKGGESIMSTEAGNMSAQTRETEETSAADAGKEDNETPAPVEETDPPAQSEETAHEEKSTESEEKETEPDNEDEFVLKYSREFSCMDADVDALITVTPVSEKEVRIDIVLPDSYEFEYYGEIIDETSVDFTLDAGEKIHMVWTDEYYFEVYPDDGFEEESVQMVGLLCTALNYQGYTINAG